MPKKIRPTAARLEPRQASLAADSNLVAHLKPLAFISHDSRDADVAEAFGHLLTDASGGMLKSFRSSDRKGSAGIEFGAEWYKAIMDKLSEATDVVALLTQHSMDRPWILYEAGVAKGKLDTTVFGVAIGIPLEKVNTGPFAQFQNCSDDEDSLTKLVFQLIRRNPEADPREEAVRRQVQAFRENIGKLLKDRTKTIPAPTSRVDENAVAKLFEEVKLMVRELPERVEGKLQRSAHVGKPRRFRKVRAMLFEQFLFSRPFRSLEDGGATAWLMAMSLFREDLPWFYEIGMDLYRALRTGRPDAIARARDRFIQSLDVLSHGPWAEELMSFEDKDAYVLFRHMPGMVGHFLESFDMASTNEAKTARAKPAETESKE